VYSLDGAVYIWGFIL